LPISSIIKYSQIFFFIKSTSCQVNIGRVSRTWQIFSKQNYIFRMWWLNVNVHTKSCVHRADDTHTMYQHKTSNLENSLKLYSLYEIVCFAFLLQNINFLIFLNFLLYQSTFNCNNCLLQGRVRVSKKKIFSSKNIQTKLNINFMKIMLN
jgi:hypothetical protein